MANVKSYLNNIKNAVFGSEVRGSIHDGIEAINNEVEDTTSRQYVLENTFEELTINAGNSNAEIVAARVEADGTTHKKLGDRLNKVDSQIKENTNKIKNIHSVKISARELNILPDTDITTQLQYILDDSGNKYQIEFEKNREYIITDSITIDLNKNSILGNGAVFSSKILDESKYTFIITSSLSKNPSFIRNEGSPMGNIVNTFNNCIIQTFKDDDNTYYRKSNGVLLSNLKGKSAHLTFDNLSILGFNEGVSFSNETYMSTFNKINIAYCNICIALKNGFSDMGERLHFCNGCIGDSDLIILNETDQSLHFHNMSLDFSNKMFDNSGQLYFTNCHIEVPSRFFDYDELNYWGDIRGTGSVFISSSRVLIAYGDSSNRQLPYLFKAHSDSSALYLNNCHMHIFAKFLLNDVGICKANNLHKYNSYSPKVFLQEKQNLYVDENCENINNIVSSNSSAQVVLDGGYKCTHLSNGANQQHIIKLPKLSSRFRISINFNTNVENKYFFNSIKIKSTGLSKSLIWDFGTKKSVSGENSFSLYFDNLNKEGVFLNPNIEYELVLNTFNLPNNTEFTITKIIINQSEN